MYQREFVLPTAERLLLVYYEQGRFPGHLTYWRRRGKWECIGVSKRVEMLSGERIEDIEDAVKKLGWRWKWINPPDQRIMKQSLAYQKKYGGVF